MASDAPPNEVNEHTSSNEERQHSPSNEGKERTLSIEQKQDIQDGEKQEVSDGSLVQSSKREIRGFTWFLIISSIFANMFIYALDNTITADLVPAIANEFGSDTLLPWLSVGFQVGAYIALLPVGKMYAKFNAKWVYIVNVVFFLASSAICGGAPNMTAMIFGRVFLGVSGSAIYAGILYFITVLAEEKERGLYISLAGLIWGVGTVLGPVIGGAFEKVNWRWAFYINIIIGGVFLPVCLFLLPNADPIPSATWRRRLEKFDFVGTILFAAFSLCLVIAINFGGVLYSWSSGNIIALFILGGVLYIAFILQQRYSWLTTDAERLYPAQLFRIKEADLLALSAVCSNAGIFIPIFYIPVYFQFTRNDSAIEAAVRLLPLIVIVSVALVVQGFFMVRVPYYFPWYTVGASLGLVGNVLLYTADINTSVAYIYGAEILVGLGLGIYNQAGYTAIYKFVPASDAGHALPFMMIAQYSGVTFGLSIAGAVFINDAMKRLRVVLPTFPESQLSALISGTSNTALDAVPEELRTSVIAAIVEGLRKVFIPAFFGTAVCLVISFFLSKKRIFGNNEAAVAVVG